jgi:hypothetical protein
MRSPNQMAFDLPDLRSVYPRVFGCIHLPISGELHPRHIL